MAARPPPPAQPEAATVLAAQSPAPRPHAPCAATRSQAGSEEAAAPEGVDVEALPLPEATPLGPLPAVPELGNWLTPQKPDTWVCLPGLLRCGAPPARPAPCRAALYHGASRVLRAW